MGISVLSARLHLASLVFTLDLYGKMMRRDGRALDKPKAEMKIIPPEKCLEVRKNWLAQHKTYAGLRFGLLFNGDLQTLKRKMVLPKATLKNIRLRPGAPGVSGDCKVGQLYVDKRYISTL